MESKRTIKYIVFSSLISMLTFAQALASLSSIKQNTKGPSLTTVGNGKTILSLLTLASIWNRTTMITNAKAVTA